MERRIQQIRKRRHFSEEFKRNLVEDFEKGRHGVVELGQLHCIAPQTIYNWIYKYSTVNKRGYRVVESQDSSEKKIKDLHSRIAELERALGQKQIKIDFLEKLIELAKDDYGFDIKKNSGTQPSSGSNKDHNK